MDYIFIGLVTILIAIPWFAVIFAPFIIFGVSAAAATASLVKHDDEVLDEGTEFLSVLIADDDVVSAMPLISNLSRNKKVELTIVGSGDEVLKELRNKTYDFLFLDMMMPNKTGAETLIEADQSIHIKKAVPVVFYTGYPKSYVKGDFNLEQFKIVDIWQKTVPYSVLTKKIDRVLEKAS